MNRITKSTALNLQSSRSHVIIKLFLDFEEDDLDDEADCDEDFLLNHEDYTGIGIEGTTQTAARHHRSINNNDDDDDDDEEVDGVDDAYSLDRGVEEVNDGCMSKTSDDGGGYDAFSTADLSSRQDINSMQKRNGIASIVSDGGDGGYNGTTGGGGIDSGRSRNLSTTMSLSRSVSLRSFQSPQDRRRGNLNRQRRLHAGISDGKVNDQDDETDQTSKEHDNYGVKAYSAADIETSAEEVLQRLDETKPRLKFRRRILTLADLAGTTNTISCMKLHVDYIHFSHFCERRIMNNDIPVTCLFVCVVICITRE